MPKVAIFYSLESHYSDHYGDEASREQLAGQATAWEDISDEDYKFLVDHRWKLAPNMPIIVQAPTGEARRLVTSLREMIDTEKRKQEEAKLAAAKKREEAAKKRLLKKVKDEQALYDELKKKYEKG